MSINPVMKITYNIHRSVRQTMPKKYLSLIINAYACYIHTSHIQACSTHIWLILIICEQMQHSKHLIN
eukprot:jgi/Botrbrau1/10985/Bobra.0234s0010.1